MSIRNLVVVTLSVALVSSSFATYTARLYFKNETTGVSAAGAVAASAGNVISMNYSFSRTQDDTTSVWTILQCGLDLSSAVATSIFTDADALKWDAGLGKSSVFGNGSKYPTKVFWEPDDTDGNAGEITGAIYDNGVDPGDNTKALVSNHGVYALVGVAGTAGESFSINLKFFSFTVGAGALPGTLKWLNEGRNTDNGITTRIYDGNNTNVKVTDNWVSVVPEPSTFAAVGMGLMSLLALRRRK